MHARGLYGFVLNTIVFAQANDDSEFDLSNLVESCKHMQRWE